jgi:deferrochelatase/peroxidase EfeB
MSDGLSRRALLGRSALLAAAAGGIGAVVGAESNDSATAAPADPQAVLDQQLSRAVAFDGAHQAGILTPPPDNATFVALDSIAPNGGVLLEALQAISARARALCGGDTVGVQEIDDPPPDSGTIGALDSPDSLTVTIAFGAALFDDRYGLAKLRPRRLTPMPAFPIDDIDPTRAGGDILLQVCATHRDTVVHTVRELLREVTGKLAVRWTIDGFRGTQRGPTPQSNPRNLFAFRDGTGNPDTGDAALMNRLIWVQPNAGEPAWAVGGTYQVIRTIRMHVEFWDRVGMLEQEEMIGRLRVSGAPLGGTDEFQDPRYDLDPKGRRIPLNAHIRLANPRTDTTADQRIVRRGYSFHRGIDPAGDLDQGLVFVAFNQDIDRQFATIQRRLDSEPMIDYITPVGGGYFFAPPGSSGAADWVGSGLRLS